MRSCLFLALVLALRATDAGGLKEEAPLMTDSEFDRQSPPYLSSIYTSYSEKGPIVYLMGHGSNLHVAKEPDEGPKENVIGWPEPLLLDDFPDYTQ